MNLLSKIQPTKSLFLVFFSLVTFQIHSQVELVQGGSTVIPSGTSSITVNIPTPVDDAKSLLIVTAAPVGTSNGPESTNVLAQLNCSSGTCNTIRIQRYGTTGTIDIGWKIVEFEDSSSVNITRGTVQHVDFVQNTYPTPDTYTVNIGATIGKSFVLLTDYANGVVTSMHDSVSGELDVNGDLLLTVGESKTAINQGEIAYQVVDYGDSVVKQGSFLLEDDTDIHSIPVSGGIPNPDKSWLIYNFWNNISSSSPVDKLMIRGSISGNNVVFDRNRASSNSYDVFGTYFLVEFTDETSVQQANMSFTSSELSKTASLSKKVNLNCAIPVVGYHQRGGSAPTPGYNYSPGWFIPKLINDGADISLTRGETNGVEADAYWSVIQFDYCSPPIEANDDDYPTPLDSASGGILGDITANDTFDSLLNPDSLITLTIDSDGGSGATIDSNGILSIPAGTSGGIYSLTYTICDNLDLSHCDSASVNFVVSYGSSTTIDFDGFDDYLQAGEILDLSASDFTLSAWIKLDSNNGNFSIMGRTFGNEIPNPSVRGISIQAQGGGTSTPSELYFIIYNPSTVRTIKTTTNDLPKNQWIHVTSTYDGSNVKLYINGELKITSSLTRSSLPDLSGIDFTIGSTFNSDGTSTKNHFDGAIDEVRVFNTALTTDQIQRMVYQEIESNGGNVHGTVINKDIVDISTDATIPWSSLISYYPMSSIVGNKIIDESSYNNEATLHNITTIQPQTAPMPYETKSGGDGLWTSTDNWLYGDVWDIEDIPNNKPWSIVHIHDNITTSNSHIQLGMFIDDTKTLTVNGDNEINNTWYLQLDGTIDLADDSQLVQGVHSDLVTSAIGKTLRRQQGNANYYWYNYWSSPVGSLAVNTLTDNNTTSNNTNNTPFSLNMLKDGTGTLIDFTSAYHQANKVSTNWLYTFQNGLTYYDWVALNQNSAIQPGFGYTQKGTGTTDTEQQYIFEGKPNNGTILVDADDVDNDSANESEQNVTMTTTLVGNPYPSALDARQFITDNSGVIQGTILLWEQWAGTSHYLAEYEGGYGYINNLTTERAYQHADIPIAGQVQDQGIKTPTFYIPVGQSFFVEVVEDGDIEFNNGQRVFKKENLGESVFFRNSEAQETTTNTENNAAESQILRLEFGVSSGASRSFVLGFSEEATDGFDYGLDGGVISTPPADDMGSLLNGEQYVIQAFSPITTGKEIDLVLHASGNFTYTLKSTEISNFPLDQDLFLKDNLTGTYYNLRSEQVYNFTSDAGTFTNRFQVVFQDPSTLSNDEFANDSTVIYVNNTEDILYVKGLTARAKQLSITNILGQNIRSFNNINNQALENGINISNLSSGVYLISVQTENNQNIDKKVIIN